MARQDLTNFSDTTPTTIHGGLKQKLSFSNINISPPSTTIAMKPIQEWHVVTGDTHCHHGRTTVATQLLRKIKAEFKQRYKHKAWSFWNPLALTAFDERLKEVFSCSLSSGGDAASGGGAPIKDDIGQVLVKCTYRGLSRVQSPNTHYFAVDRTSATTIRKKTKSAAAEARFYGIAKNRTEELYHFFNLGDSPTLERKLQMYSRYIENIRKHHSTVVPSNLLKDFSTRIIFFQQELQKALKGNGMATMFLDDLSIINTLKRQWEFLMQQTRSSLPSSSKAKSFGTTPSDPQVLRKHPHPSTPSDVGQEVKESSLPSKRAKTALPKEPVPFVDKYSSSLGKQGRVDLHDDGVANNKSQKRIKARAFEISSSLQQVLLECPLSGRRLEMEKKIKSTTTQLIRKQNNECHPP